MIISTMIATALLSVSQLQLDRDPVGDYYDRLKQGCEGAVNPSCCRASVNHMRKENARPRAKDKECPSGRNPISLICPSSLSWCSKHDKIDYDN